MQEASSGRTPAASLRPIFLLAFILPVAINTIEFLSAYELHSILFSNLINAQNFQLYDLSLAAISFAFYPAVDFVVFYAVAWRLNSQPNLDLIDLIITLFLWSLFGSVVSPVISTAIGSQLYGFSFNLATLGLDSPTGAVSFTLQVLRGTAEFGFLAFAALLVGRERLRKKSESVGSGHAVLNDSPQPQVDTAFGLLTTNPPPISFSDL